MILDLDFLDLLIFLDFGFWVSHPNPIQKLIFVDRTYTYTYTSCNTDKACFFKSKTRVQIICATNCGFIFGFREIIVVVSHIQVAKLLLDICNCFNGNVLLLLHKTD